MALQRTAVMVHCMVGCALEILYKSNMLMDRTSTEVLSSIDKRYGYLCIGSVPGGVFQPTGGGVGAVLGQQNIR